MESFRVAVISDIHGNRWALEAVLADIAHRAVDRTVNLGDCVFGPLDPGGTMNLLLAAKISSIRGNTDRLLVEAVKQAAANARQQSVAAALSAEQFSRLAALAPTAAIDDSLFLCHGTPESDMVYLLEAVAGGSTILRPLPEIARAVKAIRSKVILCGHSHNPRCVWLPGGQVIVNPGSVGLPAFTSTSYGSYKMETGSPHAKYAVVASGAGGVTVEHYCVPYDWEAAAQQALASGQMDWAAWLTTGRA